MRFLVDNALPRSFAEGLAKAGHDAVHVRTLGMARASDREILDLALTQERIIVSADADFGTILALYGLAKPSFVLFRRSDKRPSALLMQLLANMAQIEGSLNHGAVVVIEALPYPSESRLNEVLTESLDDESQQAAYSDRVGRLFAEAGQVFRPDAVNIAVAHLFALGGVESESERQLGGALAVSPLALPQQAQYVALGHLHRPQQVYNIPQVCRYSGSHPRSRSQGRLANSSGRVQPAVSG